jgi:bacterioferritin-associated ferredoxin
LLDEVPVVGGIEILMRASIARESWMIVCSCNVLTEVDIRASIATLDGPRDVCDVYASLGCAPKCGGCVGTICALIREAEGRDFGAEQIRQGGEARVRIDARPCEGHRNSQSGPQKRAECDAESVWRIAPSFDAALEFVGQE